MADLEADYRCVRPVLPNFGATVEEPQGVSFEEMIDRLDATLRHLQLPARFHLVGHDWGAIYAYFYAQAHPERLASLVTVDVGAESGDHPSLFGYLLFPTYQLLFGMAFAMTRVPAVGPVAAKLVVQGMAAAFGDDGKAAPKRGSKPDPYKNYPYYFAWKRILTGGSLDLELPHIPLMYAFGTKGLKSVMNFHNASFLERVRRMPLGTIVPFENSGHWLMHDETEKFNAELRDFLDRVRAATATEVAS